MAVAVRGDWHDRIMDLAWGAALLIGLVVGALVAWLVAERRVTAERLRSRELEGAVGSLRLDNDALRQRDEQARGLDAMLRPVRESLDSLRLAADAASNERSAAEATIRTQINAVQERYQSLEVATKQLVAALAKGQTRGQWGEMQLEALLDHAGLLEGTHYRRQDSRAGVDGGARPDLVVAMPGGGEILIDAKFPFDAYWAAIGTEDPGQRDEMMRKHAADVLARARDLSAKRYSDASSSPDFVVMFLPLESLLSAALDADGLLLEKTFDKRVILATPTTMLALLRTVAFGYQRKLMAENAEEIKQAGAEMLNRLGILVEHLDGMRRGLDQAVRGYNRFVGSFDSQAMSQARRLNDLGVASARSLTAPEPLEQEVRQSHLPAVAD